MASVSKCSSRLFLLGRLGQTVVNFISELQEQMCRFQKEISSKIQEKKASGMAAAAEVEVPEPSVAQGNTSGLDEEPDGTTRPLLDRDEEQQQRCGGQSVGVAC